jgi:hypothetical protein
VQMTEITDLVSQLTATPPDGPIYLTLTATGGLLADWGSDAEQTRFTSSVDAEPGA